MVRSRLPTPAIARNTFRNHIGAFLKVSDADCHGTMLASGFVKAEHSKAFLLTTVQGIHRSCRKALNLSACSPDLRVVDAGAPNEPV